MDLRTYKVTFEVEIIAAHADKAVLEAYRRLKRQENSDGIKFQATAPERSPSVYLVRDGRLRIIEKEKEVPDPFMMGQFMAINAYMKAAKAQSEALSGISGGSTHYAKIIIEDDPVKEEPGPLARLFKSIKDFFIPWH